MLVYNMNVLKGTCMIDPSSLLSSLATLDLSILQRTPMSAFFMLGLSIVISLVTSFANRLVMDMDEFKSWTIESHYVRQETMDAMRSGNQRRIAKAQKRQQDMMKTQQKMTSDRMKIMLFFMIPFLAIWQLLRNFFKGVEFIAVMPFTAPWIAPKGALSVGTWYLFCSISMNIIISRILGLTFEIEPKKD